MSSDPQVPADPPRAKWGAILAGLALLALAVVAARDFVVWVWRPAGWAQWVAPASARITDLDPRWVTVAGLLALAAGILLLAAAIRPRKKRYRRLVAASSPVWLRPVDVARFTTSAAKHIPGILSASSLARKNRVTVEAEVLDPGPGETERILTALKSEVTRAFGPGLDVRVLLKDADGKERE